MSVVEQTRDWTEQERLEWVRAYKNIIDTPINSWTPEYAINYKKKCCDNCKYFDDDYCENGVTNDEFGESIDYKDTFYCSYHKFKV